MPRRRKSGVLLESFAIRWHSIADPTTPSVDIMSSPDPLNDMTISISSIAPPSSSRRVTRSQRSQRFASLGDLPRKRLFEPEVGNMKSPQRLLVTVETEEHDMDMTSGARRKLFESPVPTPTMRHMEQTTTTTIPLRDSIEDELGTPTTPRRSGRPRTSNGTPMQTAGAKRKAGTPIRRTPRRQRTTWSGDEGAEDELSEASAQATPTSARRGHPPKSRTAEPSSGLGAARRRGGRRRQALAPDELAEIAEEAAAQRSWIQQAAPMSEDDMDLIRPPSETALGQDTAVAGSAVASNADAESDIWMATLSDQATPRAANRTSNPNLGDLPSRASRDSTISELETNMSQADDYGHLAPAASDSSTTDRPPSESGPRNNDTIAQGEDFSMIFMDSIPSLRASLHGNSTFAPAANDDVELGDETNLIINNTLESLRQEVAQDDEIDFAEVIETSEPTVVQEAAAEPTSAPAQLVAASSPRPILSPWWARKPKKMGSSPLRHQVLKTSAKKAETPTTANSERREEEEQSPTPDIRQTASTSIRVDDLKMNENSSSEIPRDQDSLPAHDYGDDDDDDEMDDLQEERGPNVVAREEKREKQTEFEENHEAKAETGGYHALSNTGVTGQPGVRRLPTPNEANPQLEPEEEENPENSGQDFSHYSQAGSPPAHPEPDLDEANESIYQISEQPIRTTGKLIKATPINQISSPLQEPHSLTPELVQEKAVRPVLSSIVRAGRVLQSITSDPPSPGDREKQLGSPFRSSGSKDSLQASKDSHNNRLMSKSPPQPLNLGRPQAAADSQVQSNDAASNLDLNGLKKPLDRSNQAADADRPWSRESGASSMGITPLSDGAMSWVEIEGPISPSLRGDNTLLQASRLSGPRAAKEPIVLGQVDGAGEETDEESQAGEDELDIWDFEARRHTPQPVRRRPPSGSKVARSVHDRGNVPSPWTRKGMQRPMNVVAEHSILQPRTTKLTDTAATKPGLTGETRDYSMLSQKRPETQGESSSKASRFDLSSFFSSPAAIPGILAEKILPAKTKPAAEPASNQAEPTVPVQAVPGMPTSSMFPLAPQEEFNPRNGPRLGVFSPVRSREPEPQRAAEHISSPSTPEKLQAPITARKQNFTPRPSQTSYASIQPSSSRTAAAVTPPRMQLSHADIHRWQQETSNASGESSGSHNLPRPLPAKSASPMKSSLRSPLKPRTPGRVVEFASSVLSPHEQAAVREQRRRGNSIMPHEQAGALAPPAGLEPQVEQPQPHNQENHDSSETGMPDPPPDESPEPGPLSKTVWSRHHWLFLDALLQLRRQGPFGREFKRGAERYLGKTVKSQGEALTLERWHLDCVDAFKAEVGGWHEGVLAKRLFALLLGEDRRRRSAVEDAPRAMFH